MKTKVWLVIWGLKDGGAEVLSREYARLADPEKFETTVITMYPFTNAANHKKALEAGVNILSVFKTRSAFTRALRVFLGKWYVPHKLKKMLNREKPDTIHFNSPMAVCFAGLQKQLSGVNLLYTCHNEVDKHFFDKEEFVVRRMIREHNLRLIALHDDMKQELDRHFVVTNTTVIRNGIDLERFRSCTKARSEIRKDIGVAQDAYLVGHIGRFSQQKNHEFLLEIFQQMAAKEKNAHLLLIGNGELQEKTLQQIHQKNLQDRVTVLSHRTDIPELLHAMDVMVFPSFYEGLSVTLVEAQASGLRCVISDSINSANLLSEKTVPVSLNASAEEWADIALNEEIRNENYGNIDDYDMNREIHRLERLYRGEVDV